MPNKEEIKKQNEAQANFDKLLTELAKDKGTDYSFTSYEEHDEIGIYLGNIRIAINSDGTWSHE